MHHNMQNLAKKMYLIKLLALSILFGFLGFFSLFNPIFAQTTPDILEIKLSRNENTATIMWKTVVASSGKVEYGTESGVFKYTEVSPEITTEHLTVLNNLNPNTTYFFKVIATDDQNQYVSEEFSFTTKTSSDSELPIISEFKILFVTGNTATLQWVTNEESTTQVVFGETLSFGQTASDNSYTTVHDITLYALKPGSVYNFIARSSDRSGNTAEWSGTIQTNFSDAADRDSLVAYDGFIATQKNRAEMLWRTNKPAQATVYYGTDKNNLNNITYSATPREMQTSISLTNLQINKTYYYFVIIRDVRNKTIQFEGTFFTYDVARVEQIKAVLQSENESQRRLTESIVIASLLSGNKNISSDSNNKVSTATTNNSGSNSSSNQTGNQNVAEDRSCAVMPTEKEGFYGYYYNHTSDEAEFSLPAYTSWSKSGRQNYWYDEAYYSFSRIDRILDFGSFNGVNESKQGDPNHFAVNWRAVMVVPTSGTYTFTMASDDDSWLFIDDRLVIDSGGLHGAEEKTVTVQLNKGRHKVEIFYADRRGPGASFVFNGNGSLEFIPLPLNCNDLNGGSSQNSGSQNNTGNQTNNEVVPSSTDTNNKYVCNSNLGYTKFVALYKTAARPDIWAITENGKRHYITSPAAFAKYGCSWDQVQIVSQSKLESFSSARLVRTLENPTIYYLFQRPQTQWLKIDIHSPSIFISYPTNNWGDVVRIDQLDINEYPDAKYVKSSRYANVYLLENGNRYWIRSEAALKRLGVDYVDIVTINDYHLQSFPFGGTIE